MRKSKSILLGISATGLALGVLFAQEDTELVLDNLLKSATAEKTADPVKAEAKPAVAAKTIAVAVPVKAEPKPVEEKKVIEPVQDEPVVVAEAPEAPEAAEVVEDILDMPMIEDAVVQDPIDMADAKQLISVQMDKVSLEDAISLFARLSGANIIIPELEDAAKVSVSLRDVEWKPALSSILDTYDYELYKKVADSEVYSVRRRPAGAPEPQIVESFELKYATVPNAAKLIRQLLPADAKISEFASRNILVVKSTESSISEVRTVLATVDRAREQVFIEAKFLELSDGAQKDLGIDWRVLQNYNVAARNLSSTFRDEKLNGGVNQVRYFDMEGEQFEEKEFEYLQDPGGGASTLIETITPTTTKTMSKALTQVSTAVLDAEDFSLVLSALEENKGVNVVSNPKIIVANEEEATISIVRKEPNLRQERKESLNDQPDLITYELDPDQPFFEYGIKLDVTPSINTSSNISVNITPALTRKFGDKPAGDNSYPIIDEKSIQTVFSLSSGQTAAIGGLTEVSDSEEERKVPVLGSIPYLGRLFSWKQTMHDQKETIIFVTIGLATVDNIGLETGLPEDSELARRQVIKNERDKAVREQGRKIYELREDERLEDMLKRMEAEEQARQEKRRQAIQEESE